MISRKIHRIGDVRAIAKPGIVVSRKGRTGDEGPVWRLVFADDRYAFLPQIHLPCPPNICPVYESLTSWPCDEADMLTGLVPAVKIRIAWGNGGSATTSSPSSDRAKVTRW